MRITEVVAPEFLQSVIDSLNSQNNRSSTSEAKGGAVGVVLSQPAAGKQTGQAREEKLAALQRFLGESDKRFAFARDAQACEKASAVAAGA